MLRLILPLVLVVLGLAAGVGAGLALRPTAEDADAVAEPPPADPEPDATREFVRLQNQFVVPVVEGGRVASLVILSLSIEVTAGSTEAVFAREPRLRDTILQVLFDHANAGGFRGRFTDGVNMNSLRVALAEAARQVIGPAATDVLIVDIVRQDS
jgi:flagellar basal body-associated protein FliL